MGYGIGEIVTVKFYDAPFQEVISGKQVNKDSY